MASENLRFVDFCIKNSSSPIQGMPNWNIFGFSNGYTLKNYVLLFVNLMLWKPNYISELKMLTLKLILAYQHVVTSANQKIHFLIDIIIWNWIVSPCIILTVAFSKIFFWYMSLDDAWISKFASAFNDQAELKMAKESNASFFK